MNLLIRCLTAVVGIPIIYLLIQQGAYFILFLVVAQSVLSAREFYAMARGRNLAPVKSAGTLFAGALPVCVYFSLVLSSPEWMYITFSVVLIAVTVAVLSYSKSVEGAIARISVTVFGVVYFGGLFSTQLLLRHDPSFSDETGAAWLLLAYLLTWVVDSGSYIGGKLFGSHKMSPVLSPGKTWEGAFSGLVFTIIASYFLGYMWLGLFDWGAALIFGVCISIVAPAGDLIESVFKRDSDIKDSSDLIPGHGGVLDRFDSLLFTVPFSLVFRYLSSLV